MTSIDWKSVLKSPQAVISFLAAGTAVAGTAGILNTGLPNAIQGLLTALLGVVTAIGHTAASAKVAPKRLAALAPATPSPDASQGS